ncbi:mitochondrial dicarboxylate carrier-like isoform X1 [Schistocerca serialis cubense]|uniref:mitochondrial dicarboxylate carrier-like isoform X1 n=2 Tax=Schistocerca serialis cubense TaxID=2023355 RepID=UPI00214E8FFE|nr:mitochondrial dicarboxylate carrier-like isoform X1 [Schistocerca serialis cubense]XP_049949665.1 mitochondrial dicarboxylate carrier-like isoform X1 [Schistocerca serialis cubense]XP_049949666.1 mitochondrial dicarboxylate carrier-like isoform X1 [Schistocerca serialis cubense]
MMQNTGEERRIATWWMGGVASAGACCFTQCLDTVKVQMQTQQEVRRTMLQTTMDIIHSDGILALNNGLSAAIMRQLTYSTFRFAFYEAVKQRMDPKGNNVPFHLKIGIAAVGGTIGGFIGTPADVINVRMQNDMKLPRNQRRNYRHVFDGLARIYKEEGMRGLFSGATMATGRSILMTVGQLTFYDQCKGMLMYYLDLKDNISTHFLASIVAGAVATTLTQPIDVLKTRTMNARPGEFKSMWHIILHTAKLGPQGFFKGYILRFVRLAPHTILTFIFFEQLRLNFGRIVPPDR